MKDRNEEVLANLDILVASMDEIYPGDPLIDTLILYRHMLELCSRENETRILLRIKNLIANEIPTGTARAII
jgi:hypothetical protein